MMNRTSLPLISHFDYSILFTVLAGVRASFGDENFSGEEKAGSVNDIGIRGRTQPQRKGRSDC